ncbi:MAG: glycogen synthase [Actinomycetia bacterium]|nr:glycogen synthase [Actinomycetes bacterium]
MKIGIFTREWPPDVYGGAGVHVEQLVQQLRLLEEVDVFCFGEERTDAQAFSPPAAYSDANMAVQTLAVDLEMVDAAAGCDLMHSHTWYANMAGHLASLLYGVPHVISAHSLEPRRPWKEEQLGGGYRISSWVERAAYRDADAIIAVSHGMRADVLDCYPDVDPDKVKVVHNGIDTNVYTPVAATGALERYGVPADEPFAFFVGRITRQKGLPHLLRAAEHFAPGVRLVLAASSPDTPELGDEVAAQIVALKARRGEDRVIWIDEQMGKEDIIEFYSHATAFVCPSVYEPLGIVNLEAMACETAVVASDVGGIPEVVDAGETGLLVHYDQSDPKQFEEDFAAAVNTVCTDAALATQFGVAGRERAVTHFAWDAIARRTVTVYEDAIANR